MSQEAKNIGGQQWTRYSEIELPNFTKWIEAEIAQAGSPGALVEKLNEEMAAHGWPRFRAGEFNDLTSDRTPGTRRDGWNARTVWRIAKGFKLDSDTRWAEILFMLRIFGLWDGDPQVAYAIKQVVQPTPPATVVMLIDAIDEQHPGSLLKLFTTTSLSQPRLDKLRMGDSPYPDEVDAITAWADSYGASVSPRLFAP